MLFRINKKNYLLHMIDYFPAEELLDMQYIIVTSEIQNSGTMANVTKLSVLGPSTDAMVEYIDRKDISVLRKMYFEELKETEDTIYLHILSPILKSHHDIILMYGISSEEQEIFVDLLVEYINKEFNLECINLDELFTKGETDIFYIDRDEILNSKNMKSLENLLKKQATMSREKTSDGKMELLNKMTRGEKLKKLKSLGISVGKNDKLDDLLIDSWVNKSDDDEWEQI